MKKKYNIFGTSQIIKIFHYKLSIHNEKESARNKKNRGVNILKNL